MQPIDLAGLQGAVLVIAVSAAEPSGPGGSVTMTVAQELRAAQPRTSRTSRGKTATSGDRSRNATASTQPERWSSWQLSEDIRVMPTSEREKGEARGS